METVYVIKSPDGFLTHIHPNRTYSWENGIAGEAQAIKIPTKLEADKIKQKYFKYALSIRVWPLRVVKEERDLLVRTWRQP